MERRIRRYTMLLRTVYENIRQNDFDIHGYTLCKAEADIILQLLEEKMQDRKEEDDLK